MNNELRAKVLAARNRKRKQTSKLNAERSIERGAQRIVSSLDRCRRQELIIICHRLRGEQSEHWRWSSTLCDGSPSSAEWRNTNKLFGSGGEVNPLIAFSQFGTITMQNWGISWGNFFNIHLTIHFGPDLLFASARVPRDIISCSFCEATKRFMVFTLWCCSCR